MSSAIAPVAGMPAGAVRPSPVELEISGGARGPHPDAALFRASLERRLDAAQPPVHSKGPSLGEKISARVNGVASQVKKDQQYVSKLLEQASRTGDSMQLMKAMMALTDYQVRVQTISKTVAKATNAFDQLTKLQ